MTSPTSGRFVKLKPVTRRFKSNRSTTVDNKICYTEKIPNEIYREIFYYLDWKTLLKRAIFVCNVWKNQIVNSEGYLLKQYREKFEQQTLLEGRFWLAFNMDRRYGYLYLQQRIPHQQLLMIKEKIQDIIRQLFGERLIIYFNTKAVADITNTLKSIILYEQNERYFQVQGLHYLINRLDYVLKSIFNAELLSRKAKSAIISKILICVSEWSRGYQAKLAIKSRFFVSCFKLKGFLLNLAIYNEDKLLRLINYSRNCVLREINLDLDAIINVSFFILSATQLKDKCKSKLLAYIWNEIVRIELDATDIDYVDTIICVFKNLLDIFSVNLFKIMALEEEQYARFFEEMLNKSRSINHVKSIASLIYLMSFYFDSSRMHLNELKKRLVKHYFLRKKA